VVHGLRLGVSVDNKNIKITVDREHACKAILNSATRRSVHAREFRGNDVEADTVPTREGRDMLTKGLIRRSIGEQQGPRVDQSSIEI